MSHGHGHQAADGSRCPACHLDEFKWDPLVALALGVGLGAALGQERTTKIMCEAHRTKWVIAMARAAATTWTPVGLPDPEPPR